MARFFPFRKSKVVIDEQQNDRSSHKSRPVRKLLRKAKDFFRSDQVVKLPTPLQPLIIPVLTEGTGDLQDEIDAELLLLKERTDSSDCVFSSSTPLEQHTVSSPETSSDPGNSDDAFTPPSTASSGLGGSGKRKTRSLLGQPSASNSRSSDQVQDGAFGVDTLPSGTNLSLSDKFFPQSSSSLDATAEASVLESVRRTWSNARMRLRSSSESWQPRAFTSAETFADGSPPSSWIDRVVDDDLRQDLMASRILMIRRTHDDLQIPNRLRSLSTPGADNVMHQGHPRAGKSPAHAAQLSADWANDSFFKKNFADDPDSIDISSLFAEPETLESTRVRKASTEPTEAALETGVGADLVYVAQSQLEVEIIRRGRSKFAESLHAGLAEQKANLTISHEQELAKQQEILNSRFEESYDSSAQLHEIEMLNLQDDHAAQVNELKQVTKKLRARLADMGKFARASRCEMATLRAETIATNAQLHDRSRQCDQLLQAFQERETALQQQTEELHNLKEELARTRRDHRESLYASQQEIADLDRSHKDIVGRYNALMTGFNQLNANRQNTEAQLEAARAQLESAQVAMESQDQANGDLRNLFDHVVSEKVRDFSWHVAQHANSLSMKPMNMEDEIAQTTQRLREKLEGQIEHSAELHDQLESAQASRKARVKKLKRVIANQGQEKVILEMALSMAQGQRDHWAEQYDQAAEALNGKLAFSSFERGLAERNLALQETRFALEAQLLNAKTRGDRAVLDCEIRRLHEGIKLEKRDVKVASLNEELQIMKQKLEYESGMALMYKEVIDKEMPDIRTRNSELESMLEDQVTNHVKADHRAVFSDLQRRMWEAEETNAYWEHDISTYMQEYSSIQTQWNMLSCSVYYDLTNAHSWRNDRDRLEIENVALKERFADDLTNDPLVLPQDSITSQKLEDDFKLESINDCLLKQFGVTWGTVPEQIMGMDAPPWEQIQVDVHEDIAAQKERWIAERDALIASFQDKTLEDLPNNHEWIDDMKDLEAMWKGTTTVIEDSEQPAWKGKGKEVEDS